MDRFGFLVLVIKSVHLMYGKDYRVLATPYFWTVPSISSILSIFTIPSIFPFQ